MAKPRIFISSTFYDLRQIRSDIDLFIENLGYEPIRNEEGDIPYGKEEALEEYCYKEIKSVDILISIIGGRFGSESKRDNSSISQTELKTALKENKQVYIFIEKNVLSEYETYLLNKDIDVKYRFVDNIKIYQFIEEIKNLNVNNNIKGFETASEITKYLKEQFAGLFQRFLEEQTKIKEASLIANLDRTSQTLNKLVTYLSEQNIGQAENINRILMINHPLITSLREKLKITYNFYIEGLNDLKLLLKARGFSFDENSLPFDKYYSWGKNQKNGNKEFIEISTELFDKDDKLKYINTSNWDENYVVQKYETIASKDDDLPF
ncbi:DUF4062 domain-containing protein [Phocaeicola coprocola]|uniref:DUF4062 domain-containing protein n=1 Tax=Phocaeicola coprocola TaxID=310298 RepID=UPI00195D08B8|nr:DUF4062 domain-containing protein [Phocaeicola coprocola]MBM6904400.1 DUF4062 domain-containing protein [Phocaeicola coprocola]